MSIIDDFTSLNVELAKLEQAKMPAVKPDFSATDTGDVTDEQRKALHAMYGIPMGGGIDDMAVCLSAFPVSKLEKVTINVAQGISAEKFSWRNRTRPSWYR